MNDTPKTIAGVPIDEALRVLAIYKTVGAEPSRDFAEGFKAGYTTAHEEVLQALKSTVLHIVKED